MKVGWCSVIDELVRDGVSQLTANMNIEFNLV